MKQKYQSPTIDIVHVSGSQHLMQYSSQTSQMLVDGTNKVSSTNSIGFVKDNSSAASYSVWDDDWSE